MGAGCCCCEKKPPIRPEPIPIPRYTQISISTINHLKLINGYLNEPILPLEEALKPFHGKIDQLSDKIKEAKMNCCYPSQHNLTHDESAAIYIYTMKWKSTCLYDHLQAAWNSEDRSQLEPWFKYLKLFKRALDKLPNVKTEVWQGTAFDEKLNEKLSSNSLLLYSSMGSCSPLENDIKDYLHNKQIKKTILLGYDCIDGKLAAGYTANNSKEVIVWPGMKLDVSKCIVTDNNGSLIYHLMGQADSPPKPIKAKVSPSNIHFVCPYKGCGNHCPGDHNADHCHGFAIIFHACHHHCSPGHKCDKCGIFISHLCKCYNCGGCYCIKCCYRKVMLT